MATYNITINEKTKAGKNLVALLKSLNGIVTFNQEKKTSGFEEANSDIKKGRVNKAKDSNDLFKKCLS